MLATRFTELVGCRCPSSSRRCRRRHARAGGGRRRRRRPGDDRAAARSAAASAAEILDHLASRHARRVRHELPDAVLRSRRRSRSRRRARRVIEFFYGDPDRRAGARRRAAGRAGELAGGSRRRGARRGRRRLRPGGGAGRRGRRARPRHARAARRPVARCSTPLDVPVIAAGRHRQRARRRRRARGRRQRGAGRHPFHRRGRVGRASRSTCAAWSPRRPRTRSSPTPSAWAGTRRTACCGPASRRPERFEGELVGRARTGRHVDSGRALLGDVARPRHHAARSAPMALYAGRSVESAREVKPAREIVAELMDGAEALLREAASTIEA